MSFLDDNSLLFGDSSSIRVALDTKDGQVMGLDTNGTMADMMADVDLGSGVEHTRPARDAEYDALRAWGRRAKVADYETIKKRLVGSRYTMNFTSGVNFDLTVLTSDAVTAGSMSSLVKAGIVFKKMNATPVEKVAYENTAVDSDGSNLQIHFKANDQQFQALMHSDLFAAVSH